MSFSYSTASKIIQSIGILNESGIFTPSVIGSEITSILPAVAEHVGDKLTPMWCFERNHSLHKSTMFPVSGVTGVLALRMKNGVVLSTQEETMDWMATLMPAVHEKEPTPPATPVREKEPIIAAPPAPHAPVAPPRYVKAWTDPVRTLDFGTPAHSAIELAMGGGDPALAPAPIVEPPPVLDEKRLDGYMECNGDGCTKLVTPDEIEAKCTQCAKCIEYETVYTRDCIAGCGKKVFTSKDDVKKLEEKYGVGKAKPYTCHPTRECFKVKEAKKAQAAETESLPADETFVVDEKCKTESCKGHVQLTAKNLTFYESRGIPRPTRCTECIESRKVSKASLASADKTITTLNCTACKKGFFTAADLIALQNKYGKDAKPPKHCSKTCKQHEHDAKQSKEGATRGGKRTE